MLKRCHLSDTKNCFVQITMSAKCSHERQTNDPFGDRLIISKVLGNLVYYNFVVETFDIAYIRCETCFFLDLGIYDLTFLPPQPVLID